MTTPVVPASIAIWSVGNELSSKPGPVQGDAAQLLRLLACRGQGEGSIRQHGYMVYLYFLWLPDPTLNVRRVAQRVQQGEHNVPEDDVRRRYRRGIANFLNVYRPLTDHWIEIRFGPGSPEVNAKSTVAFKKDMNGFFYRGDY